MAGDDFSKFEPQSPSNVILGNAKVIKEFKMPEAFSSTWDNFIPPEVQHRDSQDPREEYRNKSQNNNPSQDKSTAFDGQNIGKPQDYSPNNRVTQQIQKDDGQHTNSYVKQAEELGHRMLTEMGSGDWLKQVKNMANVGQVSSIMSLLSGAMGSGGGGSSGQGSGGGANANGMPSGIDLTDIVSGWTQDAVNAAQNQNNAQQNGQDIPWHVDITQANAIPLVINNAADAISNTLSRAPQVIDATVNAVSSVIDNLANAVPTIPIINRAPQ